MTRMRQFLDHCPGWVREFYMSMPAWRDIKWEYHSDDDENRGWDGRQPAVILADAEAVSSDFDAPHWAIGPPTLEEVMQAQHAICIDLDEYAALIPSTTVGHHHLLVKEPCSWENYLNLLKAMEACGMVSANYVRVCEERGATFVRLPWIHKGSEKVDRRLALSEWIDHDEDRPAFMESKEALSEWLDSEAPF